MTAYRFNNGFEFDEVPWGIYKKQKTNQVFKLLPLKEEEGEWEAHLNSIILEIGGVKDLTDQESFICIQILGKLEGIKKEESFIMYRKTIFEIISLLEGW